MKMVKVWEMGSLLVLVCPCFRKIELLPVNFDVTIKLMRFREVHSKINNVKSTTSSPLSMSRIPNPLSSPMMDVHEDNLNT